MKNIRKAYQDFEEKEKLYKGESYRNGYQIAKKELEEGAQTFFYFTERIYTETGTAVKEIMEEQRNNPQVIQELKKQEIDLEKALLSENFATI